MRTLAHTRSIGTLTFGGGGRRRLPPQLKRLEKAFSKMEFSIFLTVSCLSAFRERCHICFTVMHTTHCRASSQKFLRVRRLHLRKVLTVRCSTYKLVQNKLILCRGGGGGWGVALNTGGGVFANPSYGPVLPVALTEHVDVVHGMS